jgi:hypothetical protein
MICGTKVEIGRDLFSTSGFRSCYERCLTIGRLVANNEDPV